MDPAALGGGPCTDVSDCGAGFECVADFCVPSSACGPQGCTGDLGVVFDGDIEIVTPDDMALLDGINTIKGTLVIGNTAWDGCDLDSRVILGLETIELPDLRRIEGDLKICYQPSLTRISLPALTTGQSSIEIVGNTALSELEMPVLEGFVYGNGFGSINIESSPLLEKLSVPSLPEVGWLDIDIDPDRSAFDAPPGLDVDFSALERVRALYFFNAPGLAQLRLGKLETVASPDDETSGLFWLDRVGTGVLELGSLAEVKGELTLGELGYDRVSFPALTEVFKLRVEDTEALTNLSFGSLATVGQGMVIDNHALLDTLSMPSLTFVSSEVTITDCPALDACAASAIAAAAPQGATIDLSGLLGDAANCP